MKWLLVVLFLNVQPHGFEVHGYDFMTKKECQLAANEINEKQHYINVEANRMNKLHIEQVYAWCEKK